MNCAQELESYSTCADAQLMWKNFASLDLDTPQTEALQLSQIPDFVTGAVLSRAVGSVSSTFAFDLRSQSDPDLGLLHRHRV